MTYRVVFTPKENFFSITVDGKLPDPSDYPKVVRTGLTENEAAVYIHCAALGYPHNKTQYRIEVE